MSLADCGHPNPTCAVHESRYSGCTGRLIKKTAKGGQVLLEGGTVVWIPARGYTTATPQPANEVLPQPVDVSNDALPQLPAPQQWATIPVDVLTLVLSHLEQREVALTSTVCKHWRTAAMSPTLWVDWDFLNVEAVFLGGIHGRRAQRRFLSYGLFMKARGARARSLRWIVETCPSMITPLSDIEADAKPLLWHLNHFFEGIVCSELRNVIIGHVNLLGPLSEIEPLVRGAARLRELRLLTLDPRALYVGTLPQFSSLKTLLVSSGHIMFGNMHYPGFDAGINRVLAACPVLQELKLSERCRVNPPPYTLTSSSVEVLNCDGEGFGAIRALDMPSLRHCNLDIQSSHDNALPSHGHMRFQPHCCYDLFSPLANLKTVTVNHNEFRFPAARGFCTTIAAMSLFGQPTTLEFPFCACTACDAAAVNDA